MTLTEKNGVDSNDYTAQWWDEVTIPDITSGWIYIEMLIFYTEAMNGFTEVEVYQGKSE